VRRDSWNGQLVEDSAAFFVPPRSAYVPQVPRLFSEHCGRTCCWAGPLTLERWTGRFVAVLEPDLASLAQGIDTLVGPRE